MKIKNLFKRKHNKKSIEDTSDYFKIGDRVYNIRRKMQGVRLDLTVNPAPEGSKCEGLEAVLFDDGQLWISQDTRFFKEKNGNYDYILISRNAKNQIKQDK